MISSTRCARDHHLPEYQNIVYTEFLPGLLGPNTLTNIQGLLERQSADLRGIFHRRLPFRSFDRLTDRDQDRQRRHCPRAAGPGGRLCRAAQRLSDQRRRRRAVAQSGARRYSQQEGATINSDLRNMLNANPPGDVGDLAAIDILRERDLGIATLNQTREALGMTPYTRSIRSPATRRSPMNSSRSTAVTIQVELFVGGLAEDPASGGSMVGPTFQAIIAQQFENLADGDPLFYQNQGSARSS